MMGLVLIMCLGRRLLLALCLGMGLVAICLGEGLVLVSCLGAGLILTMCFGGLYSPYVWGACTHHVFGGGACT